MKRPDGAITRLEGQVKDAQWRRKPGEELFIIPVPEDVGSLLVYIAHLESQLEGYRRQDVPNKKPGGRKGG